MVGILECHDHVTNIVLSQTVERIVRGHEDEEASAEVVHGAYILHGSQVVLVGLVDEELDKSIDWTKVKGNLIGTTKH